MAKVYIILGAPGSGKGTQAKRLAQKLGLIYFGTGDLMREEAKKATPLGLEFKKVWDEGKGGLVSEELVQKFIGEKIKEINESDGIVFDGYPRTIAQAEHLGRIFKEKGIHDLQVINLVVKADSLIQRTQKRRICASCNKIFRDALAEGLTKCDECGGQLIQREEDMPEVLSKRIDVYEKQTTPLIDYYQKTGKLINIDGEPPIDEVWEEIEKVIE